MAISLLAKAKQGECNKYSPKFIQHVRRLVRTAAQGSTLAHQDTDPVVALLHVNTSLAYAKAAREMMPSQEVEKVAGVDVDEMIYILEEELLDRMQAIHQIAPNLQPEGPLALHSGWLG